MSVFKRVFSNTFYLAGTNGINTLVALAFAMISTRYFTTARFGQLVAVLTLTTFLENILRGSVGLLLTHRVAQRNGQAGEYFLPAMWIYLCSGFLFVLAGSAAEWYITRSMLLVWAVVLSTLISIARLIADSSLSILRGFEQMGQEFWTTLIERLLFLALLVAVVKSPWDRETTVFLMVFAVNVFTQVVQMFMVVVPLWRKLHPSLRIDRGYVSDLLSSSWMLWITAGIVLMSTRVDLFLVQILSGDFQLGVFASTLKIMDIIRILPGVICVAIYPTLSRCAGVQREEFSVIYATTMKLLMLLAIPITVFGYFLSAPLLIFLFSSKFEQAIPLMRWMSLGIVPMIHNILFGYGLFAKEKRRLLVYSYGGALLVHTLIGAILVKGCGATGGAISFGIGEWTLMAIALWISPVSFAPFTNRAFLRPTMCCLITGLALLLLYRVSLPGALAVGAVAFLWSVYFCRVFSREEYQAVKTIYANSPGSI